MKAKTQPTTSWDKFLNNHSGTSAVEFAILSPVFFLVLIGMMAYGIYFGASHSIQQIAADAARAAIAGINQSERQTLATGFISRNAGGYAFVDPAKLTVDTHDSIADGSQFVVRLSYDARQLPIWALLSNLPLPDVTIVRSSTIRVGGI
jgi:Flp pilus assembly protein TadG